MAQVLPRYKEAGTSFSWEIRKPHAGLVQFCVVFPDSDHYVWREIQYHAQDKIIENQTTGVPAVPAGWHIEEHGQVTILENTVSVSTSHSLGGVPSRTVASEGQAQANASTVTITLADPAAQDTVIDYMAEIQA